MGKSAVSLSTYKLFYFYFTVIIATTNCQNVKNNNNNNNFPVKPSNVLRRNIQGNNYLESQNHQNIQKRSGWLLGGFTNPIDVATDNFQSSFGSTQYQPYNNQFDLNSQSYQPNIPHSSDILLANRELPLTPSSTGNVPNLVGLSNFSNDQNSLDISAILKELKKLYNYIKEKTVALYKKTIEVLKFVITKIINAIEFLKSVPIIGVLVQILEEALSFMVYLPKKLLALVKSVVSTKAKSFFSMRTLGMLASLI